jgi:chemotaxis protein MotA
MSALFGLGGIFFALYYVFTAESAGFKGYFDLPSFVLVFLSPPCVLLLSHTFGDFKTGIQTLIGSILGTQIRARSEVINTLTQTSGLVRSQGLGALMNVKDRIGYELMRDGVALIVNNFTPEEIRHNIQAKINAKQSRMALAGNLFENMAKIGPGAGMLGTLIGLISMMANLKNPDQIGGGMALAMITTLYGVLLGTFIYGPCAERISLEAEKALEIDLMVLEGVLGLKGKKSSVHMRDILRTYNRASTPAPTEGQQRRKGA